MKHSSRNRLSGKDFHDFSDFYAIPKCARNMRWTVLHSLVTRPHIRDYIEKWYEENRVGYYQAYRTGPFSTTENDFSYFTTETKELVLKTAGILSWAEQHHDYKVVLSLIQKGFKYTWDYLKRNPDGIEYMDFMLEFSKKNHFKEEDNEQNIQGVIGWYVCIIKGLPFGIDMKKIGLLPSQHQIYILNQLIDYMEYCYQLFQWEALDIGHQYRLPEEVMPRVQSEELKWGVGRNLHMPLKKWIMKIRKEEGNMVTVPDTFNNVPDIDEFSRDASYQVTREGQTRALILLLTYLGSLGIQYDDLIERYVLKSSEFKRLVTYVHTFVVDGVVREEEVDMMISSLLVIMALSEDYRKTQNKYFSLHVEEWEYQYQQLMEDSKQKLAQAEADSRKSEQEWNRNKGLLEAELQHMKEEKEMWRRKALSLESQAEKSRETEKEMASLKQYLSSLENQGEDTFSLEDKITALAKKKIVIIGGHPNWKKKVKGLFPDYRIVGVEELNRDLSYLDFSEAVFLNTSFFSHSFYWKVMSKMSKNSTPLYYINESTNLEQMVQQLYQVIATEGAIPHSAEV
ncbi:hypothetical protein [Neobacillus niacini]|uniref:hypothetical protein n=1 Tax=Neobacillus niacini TaxID=86668 RepID=UPI0021CB43C5|nr:hypothetical protein [Neobacillus niacini]MCM3768150.1 hypothetical protein [Neobacillus niacini]